MLNSCGVAIYTYSIFSHIWRWMGWANVVDPLSSFFCLHLQSHEHIHVSGCLCIGGEELHKNKKQHWLPKIAASNMMRLTTPSTNMNITISLLNRANVTILFYLINRNLSKLRLSIMQLFAANSAPLIHTELGVKYLAKYP